MNKETSTVYYSRIETDDAVTIVWKPFASYSTIALVVLLALGVLFPILIFAAIILFIANTIVYSTVCKDVRMEIDYYKARGTSIQISGNKYSFSAPLTVIIDKAGPAAPDQAVAAPEAGQRTRGSLLKRIVLCILAALFSFLGLFSLLTLISGIEQNIYFVSVIMLLLLTAGSFLLAFLCIRACKK